MVSLICQSFAIMYFLLGLVTLASVAQALPIPSSDNDGSAILTVRFPSPRLIPDSGSNLSNIFANLGLHVDIDALKEAVQHNVIDQIKSHNSKDVSNTDTVTKDNTNNTTVAPDVDNSNPLEDKDNTHNVVQDLVDTLTSTLKSALNDSDEHNLSS